MEKPVKVNFQGKQVDGVELDFKARKEEWNEYEVSDGTIIRMKLVATNIVRLENQYDRDGNPIYTVKSSNVLGITAPENLMKQDTKIH